MGFPTPYWRETYKADTPQEVDSDRCGMLTLRDDKHQSIRMYQEAGCWRSNADYHLCGDDT